MKNLRLREKNWMSKFEAWSRIQKCLDTIWIFSYISLLSVFQRHNENQNTDNKNVRPEKSCN